MKKIIIGSGELDTLSGMKSVIESLVDKHNRFIIESEDILKDRIKEFLKSDEVMESFIRYIMEELVGKPQKGDANTDTLAEIITKVLEGQLFTSEESKEIRKTFGFDKK